MRGHVKTSAKSKARSRRRGRPRSAEAREAILRAARELLAEGGPAAVTMEGVAARAGVGKPTVYRWWPDRHAVAMAALMEGDAERPARKTPRSAIQGLRQQLRTIADRFASPTGRHVTTMIAASETETEFSKAFQWNRGRFASFCPIEQQRCASEFPCNSFDLVFIFRRFDEQDVGAGFTVYMSTLQRTIEPLDRTRIRSRDDDKI